MSGGRGFFPESVWHTGTKAPGSGLVPHCGACGLYKGCTSPKMEWDGEGRKKILLVGDAPGPEEDAQDRPFVGPGGQLLESMLGELGLEMRRDCWLTNALICRPHNDATPDDKRVSYCRPNLTKTLQQLRPNVIIPIGATAVHSVLTEAWKESPGALARWVGWQVPCTNPNAWICPTYHPTHLRAHDQWLERAMRVHLREAVALAPSPPWETPPRWEERAEIVLDPAEVAKRLRRWIAEHNATAAGGEAAFDYEANATKPEYPGFEILSASACWQGRETIAYPWVGEAVVATGEFLHSGIGMIASNMKYEDRLTRWAFGKPVRRWAWDTMLAAHVLDNRQGICGLKFQAFVNLGASAYDEAIEEFIRAHGTSQLNLLKSEVDLKTLLTYGGTDAVVTYFTAQRQRQLMKERFAT